ncbi:MAG: hypothetical protein RLP02_17945 [Coleofasciculus sp. C2-GNP5-27]
MGKQRTHKRIDSITEYGVAATSTIQEGDLVVLDSNGYATASAGTESGSVFVGVSRKAVDNSSGANGDLNVPVARGVFKMPFIGLTVTDVGSVCYLTGATEFGPQDDGGSKGGLIVKRESATEGWVDTTDLRG